eukprot:TRINITY_DN2800_c0_g1_i1.p1 TRINITY_DN2800_c0_g1~~TRINITY_DN2800_c0_g1_i1.p1  ORF type:complete len:942 (+),score=257.63 TRINITY_DN2800_c0_g1_i1:142-2967(+)
MKMNIRSIFLVILSLSLLCDPIEGQKKKGKDPKPPPAPPTPPTLPPPPIKNVSLIQPVSNGYQCTFLHPVTGQYYDNSVLYGKGNDGSGNFFISQNGFTFNLQFCGPVINPKPGCEDRMGCGNHTTNPLIKLPPYNNSIWSVQGTSAVQSFSQTGPICPTSTYKYVYQCFFDPNRTPTVTMDPASVLCSATYNVQLYCHPRPSLSVIDYRVPTEGGLIRVNGSDLINETSFEGLPFHSTFISSSQFSVQIPPGVGNSTEFRASISGMKSLSVATWGYLKPTIEKIVPSEGQNGRILLTISGSNFGNQTEYIYIQVGNGVCTNVTLKVSHTEVSCETYGNLNGDHLLLVIGGQEVSSNVTVDLQDPDQLKAVMKSDNYPVSQTEGEKALKTLLGDNSTSKGDELFSTLDLVSVKLLESQSNFSISANGIRLMGKLIIGGEDNQLNSTSGSISFPKENLVPFSSNSAILFHSLPFDPFVPSNNNFTISLSKVLGWKVVDEFGGEYKVNGLQYPISLEIPLEEEIQQPEELECLWWNPSHLIWSSEGCKVASLSVESVICECDHLTNFTLGKRLKSNDVLPSSNNPSAPIPVIPANNNAVFIVVPIVIIAVLLASLAAAYFVMKKKKQLKDRNDDLELNYAPNLISSDSIQIHEKIGSGAFGSVYLGTMGKTNQVALKKLASVTNRRAFYKEAETLKSLHHPNIVLFIGYHECEEDIYLVMEYLPMGDLLSVLQSSVVLGTVQKLNIALQIAAALRYIESCGIIHADLSSRNILVKEIGEFCLVKLSDFGHSITTDKRSSAIHSDLPKFAVKWSAIEVIQDQRFSIKADIWSFAVVLWEIYEKGKTPYVNLDNSEVEKALLGGTRLESKHWSKSISSLANKCWSLDPTARPTTAELFTTIQNELAEVEISRGTMRKSDREVKKPNRNSSSFYDGSSEASLPKQI